MAEKIVRLIRLIVDFYDKNISYRLLDVLTLFLPKRSTPFLLFLMFELIACGDVTKEISGTYETTISTTSDFATDSLQPAGQMTVGQDSSSSLSSNPDLSSPGQSRPGRTLSLELYEDQRAELNTNFLNNAPPIVQKGTWSLLENDRVRTYFVEKDGKFFLDTLTFYRDGLRLVLRGDRNDITDEVNLMRVN